MIDDCKEGLYLKLISLPCAVRPYWYLPPTPFGSVVVLLMDAAFSHPEHILSALTSLIFLPTVDQHGKVQIHKSADSD